MQSFPIVIVAVALLVAGCSQSTEPAITDPLALIGPVWVLQKIDGQSVAAITDTRTFIDFDNEGQFTGNAPCNWYGGVYRTSSPAIDLDSIGGTKRGGTRTNMDLEDRYYDALRGTTRFEVRGNTLELFYQENGTLQYVAE